MQSEKVADYIVDWLKKYLTGAGMNGLVIGISGGVDSAVVSALCAKTGFPVLCVEMPIHQAKNQVNRAQKHVLKLKNNFPNVTDIQVDLSSTFETMKASFPRVFGEESNAHELALANTRSRLRMTTLYYLAGVHKFLVVGTGNKIEDFGVGFFTKYGDGGVDLNPIADLLKSEVYELAAFLKIPESILNAKPTDGLFGDDRSDEDQLGATYDELEWAMKMTEENKTAADFTGRKKEVFQIYKRLHSANLHKMKAVPVCEIPEWAKN